MILTQTYHWENFIFYHRNIIDNIAQKQRKKNNALKHD